MISSRGARHSSRLRTRVALVEKASKRASDDLGQDENEDKAGCQRHKEGRGVIIMDLQKRKKDVRSFGV